MPPGRMHHFPQARSSGLQHPPLPTPLPSAGYGAVPKIARSSVSRSPRDTSFVPKLNAKTNVDRLVENATSSCPRLFASQCAPQPAPDRLWEALAPDSRYGSAIASCPPADDDLALGVEPDRIPPLRMQDPEE